ncbi:MAG TPA: SDR family oxidoreductase [Myxococcaceae bacterium]|jgi:dTDP-4-dehydrorhamnose reductase
MRVLVTGANGLVGSRACAVLARGGHAVVGAGRGPRRAEGAFDYVSADLARAEDVARAVEAARPEAIVHAASMTEVDACERAPLDAWASNVTACELLAREAKRTGAHLVAISTDYVFDGEAGPYSEEDVPNPRGTYATTKLAGELAVRALAPSWAVARTAVVYGWPPAGRLNFGAWVLGKVERGEAVKLFQDQFVSPSLADSVAAMVSELAVKRLTGTWNTCGAQVMSRVEFGRALCAVFGLDPALIHPSTVAEAGLASPRPKRSGLKAAKAAAMLDAKPLPLFESLHAFHGVWKAARAGGGRT